MQCRIATAIFGGAVALAIAFTSAPSAEVPQRPKLVLKGSVQQEWGIAPLANWRSQRIHEGIGWRIGTVSRGDASVMKGGYTVVHPAKGKPFSLLHCYVLAAFDLLPSGILLVTVRDPEIYWSDYDYSEGLTDPVELVWYTDDWEEHDALLLDFANDLHPDGFSIAPDKLSLLAICHPVDTEGSSVQQGHYLCVVRLRDGDITALPLPSSEEAAAPPAAWWPVLIDWEDSALLVQLGDELRRYEVRWE